MKFGTLSPRISTHILFWTGLLLLILICGVLGWHLSATTEMVDVLRDAIRQDGQRQVSIIVHKLDKAIFYFAALGIPLALSWRIICEMFFLKLKALKKLSAEQQ